jgi:hypothetical protein
MMKEPEGLAPWLVLYLAKAGNPTGMKFEPLLVWRALLRVIRGGIRGRRGRLPVRLIVIRPPTVITLVRRRIAVALLLRSILVITLLGLGRLDGPAVSLSSHGTHGAAQQTADGCTLPRVLAIGAGPDGRPHGGPYTGARVKVRILRGCGTPAQRNQGR